jgi:site-specific DNA-methyltransferase (adenine-specific)
MTMNKIELNEFTFYNADNMDIMKQYPDKYFDLAIVDPPYGINIAYDPTGRILTNRKTRNGLYSSKAKEQWDDKPNKEYFKELLRVSKNQIIWGGQFFAEHLPPKQCWLVWDKMNGDSSFSDCELAYTSFDLGLRIFKKHIETRKKIHICQKPISLYEWILTKYAKDGFKILDTHLGSGSIAIAIDKANTLDKKNLTFVGIELDPDYFNASIERFRNHKAQFTLF